jgi:hypothetical protein
MPEKLKLFLELLSKEEADKIGGLANQRHAESDIIRIVAPIACPDMGTKTIKAIVDAARRRENR